MLYLTQQKKTNRNPKRTDFKVVAEVRKLQNKFKNRRYGPKGTVVL